MKIHTDRESILRAVAMTQSVINPRHALPLLSNLLLDVDGKQKVRMFGTDMDVGLSTVFEATADETGNVTIPAKKLYDILRELPEGEVNLTISKNNAITLNAGKAQFKLMGLPKDDFPEFPSYKTSEKIELDQGLLKRCLKLTSFAVSNDEMRYVLNGTLFKIGSGKIRLVATDGRRLAYIEKKIGGEGELEAIIPTKTVNELQRILSDSGKVIIYQLKNQLVFVVDETVLLSRLIEGHFPNYEQVIPKDAKTKATANRALLWSAVRRSALLTSSESQAIKIDFVKGKMLISARSPNLGEAKEEIEATVSGPEVVIGFNPNYLTDVLKHIDTEEVTLVLTTADRPGVVEGEEGYKYVIMPMQLT